MNPRTIMAIVPLLAAGALHLPATATAAPVHTASPKALALTLSDVRHVYGSGFIPFMTNTYKPSHKGGCGGTYSGGYLTMFGNGSKATKAGGVVSIENTVFAYASSAAIACVSKSYGQSLTKAMGKSSTGMTIRTSSLHGVGDNAYLFTISSAKSHGYSVMITFSRGTHSAMLSVSAIRKIPALSSVIALAKIVDARIQVAG